jgi:hypothetical protein
LTNQTDTHEMKLLDIPLMIRLKQNAIVLHSELGLTEDARGQNSALLSSIIFPRGLHTLVAHTDNQDMVGQFRYRSDDVNAHIVYLAPTLDEGDDDTIWLHILDAMAQQAGKHGAQTLVAEVEVSHRLFETMRRAGYAVYSRQVIWQHSPINDDTQKPEVIVTEEVNSDQIGIAALLGSTIPRILQTVMEPSTDMDGLVYRKNGRVEAYIACSEGKHGVYLIPYLHPDVLSEASDIIEAAVLAIDKSRKVPIYVSVRGYQGWLENAMLDLGFTPWLEQAVMVKHLTAGIRQTSFTSVKLNTQGGKQPAPNMRVVTINDNQKDTS